MNVLSANPSAPDLISKAVVHGVVPADTKTLSIRVFYKSKPRVEGDRGILSIGVKNSGFYLSKSINKCISGDSFNNWPDLTRPNTSS